MKCKNYGIFNKHPPTIIIWWQSDDLTTELQEVGNRGAHKFSFVMSQIQELHLKTDPWVLSSNPVAISGL